MVHVCRVSLICLPTWFLCWLLYLVTENCNVIEIEANAVYNSCRAWLINSRGFANKVKNCASQIKDCGASRECPKCHYLISNSDVSTEWPGFPTGVKFDPSDTDLIEHLAAKVGVGNSKPHMFIDEFIPTIDWDIGICYTHPENLPGAKKDGSSFHFFHKTCNAYSTGRRKRRKIDKEHDLAAQAVRWHKTGKTKAIRSGVHPGWKKIMVLYKSSIKGSKADKTDWVMHQYHLGSTEDEKEGEYVVSKIFYQQPKQADKSDHNLVIEESESYVLQRSPITPITNPPTTPAPEESAWCDAGPDEYMQNSYAKVAEHVPEVSQYAQLRKFEDSMSHVPQLDSQFENNVGQPTWLAGESQVDEYCGLNCFDDTLLCKETFNSSTPLNGPVLNPISNGDCVNNTYGVTGNSSTAFGIPDLENLEFDSPPDFQLTGLQFCSQDSILEWLDRL
ncbi:SUPPRESSOR OF GAMMA RESPONSE 1 isoform X4 [Rosa chinensis]|uniref:SUPPRESSOR OF GAMMA RESPONSE 1 isoform X4 n=1 Tax=Rosa chinensis TaxID=74649 RepID=UPI001AD8F5DB|nr:SUPPRESSOR OF GAMMA RESPONSE 1 isoform X4 [Rosa chinensis]